ncbi:Uncharacterised protein [Orientia tsutsugamushi]|uniref:Uncharacterized protein n=1 Tax=Orientia tsutsugamushi TaxID=784 RepID=A0A2U3QY87_ORITS|nr:hypothetical protein OTSUT76_3604 [Orientia tsutsugamushi str. UT76]SPR05879.1 Uncharacterised protein [Orientia tsutsugamushi]
MENNHIDLIQYIRHTVNNHNKTNSFEVPIQLYT